MCLHNWYKLTTEYLVNRDMSTNLFHEIYITESDDHSDEIISREDLKEALKQIKAEKIEQRKVVHTIIMISSIIRYKCYNSNNANTI